MSKREKEEKEKRKKKSLLPYFICVAIVAVAVIVVCIMIESRKDRGGEVITISEATLKQVLNISELSTAEYTYNAVAEGYDESGETLRYHVAYEGTIKAGIKDFEKVRPTVDEENKKIVIIIPDVEILECDVDPGTLAYIFTDDKFDTKEVPTEAYPLCIEDLQKEALEEPEILEKAEENTKSAVQGLVDPFVKQIDDSYTIEYRFESEVADIE